MSAEFYLEVTSECFFIRLLFLIDIKGGKPLVQVLGHSIRVKENWHTATRELNNHKLKLEIKPSTLSQKAYIEALSTQIAPN